MFDKSKGVNIINITIIVVNMVTILSDKQKENVILWINYYQYENASIFKIKLLQKIIESNELPKTEKLLSLCNTLLLDKPLFLAQSMFEWSKVLGFGIVNSRKFVNMNLTPLLVLRNLENYNLTRLQKLGLTYFDDLNKRIPRETVRLIANIIENNLIGATKFIVVGSFRRGLQTCGDIDIVFVGNKFTLLKFHEWVILQKSFVAILTFGKSKFSFLWKFENVVRQVDLFNCPPESYITYVLYGTGSALHNRILRQKLKLKKYKLNQYKLISLNSKKTVLLKNEQQVYHLANIEYVYPHNR